MPAKKIVLIGSQSVGKTAIAQRLANGLFAQMNTATLGVQLVNADLEHDEYYASTVLWDTSSSLLDEKLDAVYTRGASAILLVADATQPQTLLEQQKLLAHFAQEHPRVPCFVVINKTDIYTRLRGAKNSSNEIDDSTIYCSARTGEGMQQLIKSLVQVCGQRSPVW